MVVCRISEPSVFQFHGAYGHILPVFLLVVWENSPVTSAKPIHSKPCFLGGQVPSPPYEAGGGGCSHDIQWVEDYHNRGTPKWMVKIMENPIKHGMIWGENPLFLETPIYSTWKFEGTSTTQAIFHQFMISLTTFWKPKIPVAGGWKGMTKKSELPYTFLRYR